MPWRVPHLPTPWTHRGYDISKLADTCSSRLRGVSEFPRVSSSLISCSRLRPPAALRRRQILIDVSCAQRPQRNAPAHGGCNFLTGAPSGSASATTVTIGAVAYPDAEGRFREERGGGMLATRTRRNHLAAGLGEEALRIAEFLKISYLGREGGRTIPTCLLPVAIVHGGTRRQAVRRANSGITQDVKDVAMKTAIWL